MKFSLNKILAVVLIGGAVACNNQKAEEPKTEKMESKPAPTVVEPKPAEPKTSVSVGPDGAEVKTKDVNLKLNTKDTSRKQ